jgi:alpha-mannosidase
MQKYVDVSAPDNAWGIALLNEGKYGYDTRDGKLRLTMQKSALYPDTTTRTWAFMEREERKLRDGTTVPTNVGIGPVSCRFALFPHEGGALVSSAGVPTGRVKDEAESYNHVPIVRSLSNSSTRSLKGKKSKDGSRLDARAIPVSDLGFQTPPGLLVTAVKMREWEQTDTVILRVAEVAGFLVERGEIAIPLALVPRIASIEEMDLLERVSDVRVKWNKGTGVLEVSFAPFEVKTFGINIKRTKQ